MYGGGNRQGVLKRLCGKAAGGQGRPTPLVQVTRTLAWVVSARTRSSHSNATRALPGGIGSAKSFVDEGAIFSVLPWKTPQIDRWPE